VDSAAEPVLVTVPQVVVAGPVVPAMAKAMAAVAAVPSTEEQTK
jgi:hypothetical protein